MRYHADWTMALLPLALSSAPEPQGCFKTFHGDMVFMSFSRVISL